MFSTKELLEYAGSVLVLVGAFYGFFIRPLIKVQGKVESLEEWKAKVNEFNNTAQEARNKIIEEQRKSHEEIESVRRWRSEIEEARKASLKERAEMKEDMDYLEEKFDKIFDRIFNKTTL
jgi:uncharacterized coiled-coil DUF342 family protein